MGSTTEPAVAVKSLTVSAEWSAPSRLLGEICWHSAACVALGVGTVAEVSRGQSTLDTGKDVPFSLVRHMRHRKLRHVDLPKLVQSGRMTARCEVTEPNLVGHGKLW